ncbi:hypothetical protein RvY_11679 [Ramazzottius varieornatus]|uniref:Uncharacterized protein n=1 Tax=Ramazzottius varieornatus TaxID=947166 RepID=A0A1D1VGZ2_RAMVA|nr:hypothetical protein RvY_11679 [Ramazzottius varieornatus]
MADQLTVANVGPQFLTALFAQLGLGAVEEVAVRAGTAVLPERTRFWDSTVHLEAIISKLFGNRFPEQLLDIQKVLKASLDELEKRTTLTTEENTILLEMNPRIHGIEVAHRALVRYLQAPTVLRLEQELWTSCMARMGPRDSLHYFFTEVKAEHGNSLLDRIMKNCEKERNFTKFQMWSKKIKNAIVTGVYTRAFELRVGMERDRSPESQISIFEQLTEMQTNQQSVFDELDRAYVRLTWHFIRAPCEDSGKKGCGLAGPPETSHCSELGCLVYKFLKKQEKDTKDRLLAALREKWPHMMWKVAVGVSSSQLNATRLNPAPRNFTPQLNWRRLWFHAHGTNQEQALAVVPFGDKTSYTHGCLVRVAPLKWTLRTKEAREYGVVAAVFWCDESEAITTTTVWEDIRRRLQNESEALSSFVDQHALHRR